MALNSASVLQVSHATWAPSFFLPPLASDWTRKANSLVPWKEFVWRGRKGIRKAKNLCEQAHETIWAFGKWAGGLDGWAVPISFAAQEKVRLASTIEE